MNIRLPLAAALSLVLLTSAWADDKAQPAAEKEPAKVTLANGKITLTMPATWEQKKPATNIVEHEFAAPGAEDSDKAARVTMMGAGGSVEANIARWKKQFVKADEEAMKIEEKKIAGQTVHLVDFSGTYNDARGPFVPGVERENYRMFAAIVVTDKLGQYFIKATGPAATMEANKKAFREMVESLEVK